MKHLLLPLLAITNSIAFAQSVTISPAQGEFNTSSATSINLRSNATDSYLRFSPNGNYKGYVGAYNGTNDVDFGTGGGNLTGKLNLVIAATPKLIINNDGTVRVVNLGGSGNKFIKTDNIGTLTTQPVTFVQNISFAAFRPAGSDVNFTTSGDGTVSCFSGSSPLFAPVNLPDGATITQVSAYFVDNSASKDVSIEFKRNGVTSLTYNGATDFISEINSSGSSSAVQVIDDTTITSGLVDNSNYFYIVRIYLPSGWDSTNIRIKGLTITYQY